jgi:hypothetical protein
LGWPLTGTILLKRQRSVPCRGTYSKTERHAEVTDDVLLIRRTA